jgi:signal transduction histidine kinase
MDDCKVRRFPRRGQDRVAEVTPADETIRAQAGTRTAGRGLEAPHSRIPGAPSPEVSAPPHPPAPECPSLSIYRQARFRTTLAAGALLTAPLLVFMALAWRQVQAGALRPVLDALLIALLLGAGLALAFGRLVASHILRLCDELKRTLAAVAQRERERDAAQAELIRRLEEERELVQEKLQFEGQLAQFEKFAALAQLALGAAHEINNPLLGILSHLELELKQAGSADARMEIEQCIEGAQRISATIRNLINYARPAPLQLARVSLGRLITESLSFVRHQPLFRRIRLENQTPPDLPLVVADPNQLSQVLMNLLLNAGQAIPGSGAITLKAERAPGGESVEISVVDTGAGIPPEVLPHIFEPFFSTKRGKGTGLGLSISQAYVRSHGGEITAESSPGSGTTMRVLLPIEQQDRKYEQPVEVLV